MGLFKGLINRMETAKDILNELKSISPLLAGMPRINVFTVPEGYFDTIDTTVLACLKETDHEFHSAEVEQTNGVPTGYFDRLAGSILEKIKTGETALEETRQLSPLLYSLQGNNVFEVPVGYFESLQNSITEKINPLTAQEEISALSPLLHSLRGRPTFEVPAGYFDQLHSSIVEKIEPVTASDELNSLSPLLHSLKDKITFEAPGGYFENLSDGILASVRKDGPAKVVSMPGSNRIFKYAIAAMLTGAMALGLYKYIGNSGGDGSLPVAPVAKLDPSIEQGKNMNDQQFNEALSNLTDADIAKYLEKNGDITDMAALRNNLDESSLPSQDDYLLDATTLDDYLKEINKTTLNN